MEERNGRREGKDVRNELWKGEKRLRREMEGVSKVEKEG